MIPTLIIVIVFLIFRSWFSVSGTLSAGDWPYLFREQIIQFHWLPEARFLWLAPWYQVLTKIAVQYMGIPWDMAEKLFWFFPFILLSLFSSYKLSKSPLGALIYTTNTYALMVVGGGQMGVAMAYAIAPLVLMRFINEKGLVLNGFFLAVQMMFDPRIALLTFIASVFYSFFQGSKIHQLFRTLGTPIIVAILLNLFWIVPFSRSQLPVAQQLGETTVDLAKFLSFATFEQTISLLHPNWPENIFGKVSFMRPEFLFIAVIAFSSLLVKPQNRKILFFAWLALSGAFLAKGTNPPFGEIYAWLFTHVPGFSLFRDPTKFYLFPALSFSVLIPFVVRQLDRKKIVSILFILFWAFTIRQALLGQLTGTFRPIPVPQEYVALKDLFNSRQAYRTLWIPKYQRFGFSSSLQPALDAQTVSKQSSISGILRWIHSEEAYGQLRSLRVAYVVVPDDVRGELFVTDRTYDATLYQETIANISTLPWLVRDKSFHRIGVFEVEL